jgi:hypothetical protein
LLRRLLLLPFGGPGAAHETPGRRPCPLVPLRARLLAGAINVVLYGAPATPCFQQFHNALAAAVAANAGKRRPVVYVHRPFLPVKACEVGLGV